MPANVHLFDMLRSEVLREMSTSDLIEELVRARRMESRVIEYLESIIEALRGVSAKVDGLQ